MTLSISDLFKEAEGLELKRDVPGAVQLYKKWIALNPDDPNLAAALFNYSIVTQRSGDQFGAICILQEAVRRFPNFHPSYINLGRALEDVGQTGTAVMQWLELVNKLPALNGPTLRHKLLALQQIGRVLEGNHMDAAAEDALQQSIDLSAHQPQVVQHWIALRQKQCKWPVVQGWDGVETRDLLAAISPLSLAVLSDDPVFQLTRAASYARQAIAAPKTPQALYRRRERAAHEKLRIGYVSSDLREHAVGFGISEVMELHDRSRFEIHAYYCGIPRDDATKARIRSSVDHWTDIGPMSDDEAAKTIAAAGIDILIDLNGYTRDARTAVFARNPAPIQVNWYGFPGTMGTTYHHYIIGDPVVIPEGSEAYFSEKVVRIPCYQPNDRKRQVAAETPSRQEEGLPQGKFVFCCLNGAQKITQPVFTAWMKILAQVPDSVLWLLDTAADTNARLRSFAATQGIAPDRLCFAPKRPNPLHLARYRHADLFLDTFPYGAHTTASDAMWMGVPVVTLEGGGFASRVCASLVRAAGMGELVSTSLEDYVAKAARIGTAPGVAGLLKKRLSASRNSSLLFDMPQLTAKLEDAYRSMWSDYTAGRLPKPKLGDLHLWEELAVCVNLDTSRQGLPFDPASYGSSKIKAEPSSLLTAALRPDRPLALRA